MKRCHFLDSVVDGATRFGVEAVVGSSMFKREVVELQEFELIDCKSKSPGNVFELEELGRCIGYRGEQHV